MNRLTHRQALLAGLAIIVAVNAVALGGVAWNRSGEDSRLLLTERELSVPWNYGGDDEDSGVALELDWEASGRGLNPYSLGLDGPPTSFGIDWLDSRKLSALGFDIRPPTVEALNKRQWRMQQREVIAVLELDGPEYARLLVEAERLVAQSRAARAVSPASTEAREELKRLEAAQVELRKNSSRLFVVDAGLDRAQLRRKYPDRRRYALMPALASSSWQLDKGRMKVHGDITKLMNDRLHLSNTLASGIEAAFAPQRRVYDATKEPIELEVVLGRRLEPWVASARLRETAAP